MDLRPKCFERFINCNSVRSLKRKRGALQLTNWISGVLFDGSWTSWYFYQTMRRQARFNFQNSLHEFFELFWSQSHPANFTYDSKFFFYLIGIDLQVCLLIYTLYALSMLVANNVIRHGQTTRLVLAFSDNVVIS